MFDWLLGLFVSCFVLGYLFVFWFDFFVCFLGLYCGWLVCWQLGNLLTLGKTELPVFFHVFSYEAALASQGTLTVLSTCLTISTEPQANKYYRTKYSI